jgi:hypothetical protein
MPHNPGKQNVELFPVSFQFSSYQVVKLLGVDIDFMLNLDCHIKNICKKAVQQLNILKRIDKNLSKLNRLTIFHTLTNL